MQSIRGGEAGPVERAAPVERVRVPGPQAAVWRRPIRTGPGPAEDWAPRIEPAPLAVNLLA